MQAGLRRGRGQEMALATAVAVAIAVFSLLPMLRLLRETVAPAGALSLDIVGAGLMSRATWVATVNSLVVGIGGTVLAVALGTLVALVVTLTDMRGRSPFILFFVMPLMIAPQVTALAWLQLFGPASPFLKLIGLAPPLGSRNPLYSPGGIVLLLGIQYAPLVFLLVRAGLRRLPRELVEA
ncbi:MAG: iron ABC transporter permease, partial [Aquamicrobium sp.]|nr:iron ABC transporter permease [Aquamicrobium sp.]